MSADPAIPEGETGGLLEPNSCQVIWTLKHAFSGRHWADRQTLLQKAHWQRTRQENSGLVLPWTWRDPGNPVCLVASAEQIQRDFLVTC